MAITTLNTRMKLRYDTYENWTENNPILLKGEVAVVEVPIPAAQDPAAEPGKLQDGARPSILFKVGLDPVNSVIKDGNGDPITPEETGYRFNDLPWGSAIAADVYEWAKAAQRPTYYAGDIALSANDNTTVASQLTSLQTEVNTLTGNDNNGGTSIAQLITAAIAELDGTANGSAGAGKYVSAVTQTDGVVTVTYSDFPAEYDDTEIRGLIENIYKAGENGAAATGLVATLIGNDTGKSVRTIANEELAAQLIPAQAKESLDTLQEIAAWIQDHPDDASAMNADIAALKAKTLLGSRVVYVAADGTYEEGTTYYTDNTGATEVDTTDFEEGVTDVSSYYVGQSTEYSTVKAYVEAVTNPLATQLQTTNTTLAGKIDGIATGTEIASVTNDIVTIQNALYEDTNHEIANTGTAIELAKVAKTGMAADLSFGDGLVLDGGDSTIDATPAQSQEPAEPEEP